MKFLTTMTSAILLLVASASSWAADLTGKWVGQFKGVQIEIPVSPGPLGQRPHQAEIDEQFIEATLTISFDKQQGDLAVGSWTAGEFAQKFVCARTSGKMWECIDSAGRASVEEMSASEIKVCYFDHRSGAQGAGCAVLKKQ